MVQIVLDCDGRPVRQQLTDSVDSQDFKEQEVALFAEQLLPQQNHQAGGREGPRGALHGEPQHRTETEQKQSSGSTSLFRSGSE